MKDKRDTWLKFLKPTSFVLGFTVFLLVTFFLSIKFLEARSERPTQSPPQYYLPVFVTLGEKYELIQIQLLEIIHKENPNYSYLVRIDNLDEINRQLVDEYKNKKYGPAIPQLKVEQLTPGKQLIIIYYSGDGLFEHKYEASEKNFKSLTYKLQGPGFIFGPCFFTGCIGLVAFGVLQFIWWYLKEKQNKMEQKED